MIFENNDNLKSFYLQHTKSKKNTVLTKKGKIKSVQFPVDSINLGKPIARTSRRTLLKEGEPYNLEVIKLDRERIGARL